MRFFCFTFLLVLITSCTKADLNRTKLIHYAPENASVILRTNHMESLKSSIDNSPFFETLSNTNVYKNLDEKLEHISLLQPNGDVLICFSKDKTDSLQHTVITKYSKKLFVTDSLKNYKEEVLTYKNKTIIKSTLKNQTFYSAVIDSVFMVSSSKDIIDAAYDKEYIDTELEKVYNTTTSDKTLSVIIKSNAPFVKSLFLDTGLPLKTFTNYIAVDVDINQNQIFINGITKALDSSHSIINIFKNTIPQENQLQNITPNNSDGFMSFTFNTFENIETNLQTFTKKDSLKNSTSLFDNIIEVGVIYEENKRAIVLNSLDIISTKDELLGELNSLDTFRETDIYSFSKPDLFSKTFNPLIIFNKATKYCILDNFFVFADDSELLHSIIANYQNKTTLSEQSYFSDIKKQLNDASSLMILANPTILKNILEKNLDETITSPLSNYNASAIQFIYDTNFAHVNAIIKQTKIKASENSISEELNIKLDTDLLNTPQFVTNHITKEKEIVVQDIKNNLYLISNKGKIIWKKQLEGPVLGSIEQIDIYKNGRLQLAFATPHRVYVIDRNGKDVAPFPSIFNDNITQPLSVFDYDNNKNYRLLVTQGKNILMYDVNAKLVNGFTFKSANENIINQPQHIRIKRKDYIIFKTEKKLYILDRIGKVRVTPKTSTSFSSEPVFYYDEKFTTTSLNGEVIFIDINGNISSLNLNLTEKHHMDASSKTLVTQSENKLNIKGKTIELDFGSYTAPKLFYINDKIYVSITDLQSHKVYLYDSQGELIQNFPVYGNSVITLDAIDKDRNLEFVVKGENNSIILYEIH
ncbi:ribonuclease HII [Confluentibacter sediminis]|uniref:ribonuclease HII n=1 Tax=Confluentibacter sediminis TaxID=2219045 RepID=UPI000DACE2E4|nr:ribonuclease HII [Confluentibacter sediminis]